MLALVVGVLCVWGRLSVANPEAKRLYDDLLSNYNRLIRPVGNNSDRLTVKMGLRLSQLIDVVSTLLIISNKSRTKLYYTNNFDVYVWKLTTWLNASHAEIYLSDDFVLSRIRFDLENFHSDAFYSEYYTQSWNT